MKLLSIDDSKTIRHIIKGATQVLNYDFLEACDGNEGLSILDKNHDDIGIILLEKECLFNNLPHN